MHRLADVLLIDEAGSSAAEAAARELAGLGARVGRVESVAALNRLICQPHFAFRAVMASSDMPISALSQLIHPLGTKLREGVLAGLSFGDPGIKRKLQALGLEHPLPKAFNRSQLRFQLNRGLAVRPREFWNRGEQRAPVHWPAAGALGGRIKDVQLYTLSADGAFLETDRPWGRGAELEVLLELPSGPHSVPASVVYNNVPGNLHRPGSPYGMGVRFRELDRQTRHEIRAIVAEAKAALDA